MAIKVIRPELAEDADFRARFAREVSAAREVSGIFTSSVVDADLDGLLRLRAVNHPVRDRWRARMLGKPVDRRSRPAAGH